MDRQEPILDNAYYHVFNRGNRHHRIFRDSSDYLFFLRRLKDYSLRYNILVHVYCLMPNHYHLLLSQKKGGSIPSFMATLATSVTKRFNVKYNLVGHLFQGMYKYKRIASDGYLLHLSRYIHTNPVIARLVKEPQDWRYSSYAQFAGSFEREKIIPSEDDVRLNDCIDPLPILDLFDNDRAEYVRFVREFQEGKLSAIRSFTFED